MLDGVPANQGLHGNDLAALGVELRLVVEHQLVARDGRSQPALQLHVVERALVHRLIEELVAVATQPLRLVQRDAGVAQQGLRVAAVGRVERDAQTRAQVDSPPFQHQRNPDLLQHAPGHVDGIG